MIPKNWGFCDLSVSRNYDIKQLHYFKEMGFNTIAINTFIEEATEEPKKKKKKADAKGKQDYFPEPLLIHDKPENLNILQRITIELSDSSIQHKVTSSENLKKYDIIAVIPTTLQAFQFVTNAMDIDLISFNPENRIPFKISRKHYMQAVDRGIFFELMYSSAIRDATARKNIISTSHNYHAVGKSRNIVLTSGAENQIHVRGIYDVMNLGFLFGLNSNQSLEVVRDNTRQLILKGEARKCGKFYAHLCVDKNFDKENKDSGD